MNFSLAYHWLFLGIMALLVVVGGLLAWLLGRRISGPLAEVTRAAETIAAGDLSTRLRSTRQDEIGRLASAFNVMADHVQRSREELEERVASRTQELQAANSELEAFGYSVSHDLRSPLRAIDGFSRMLTEDYAQGVGPEGRRLLDVIRLNTKRMGHLIDDLLALLAQGQVDYTLFWRRLTQGVASGQLTPVIERTVGIAVKTGGVVSVITVVVPFS